MKKITYMIIFLIFAMGTLATSVGAAVPERKLEAVWMATVFNIDFPSAKNDVNAQKNEFIEKMDKLQAAGINTIVVQVRPKADALYKSNINPWSDVLTGTQGKDPGYDPLDFMIEEAHKRGMELHAWLNPYRVTTSGTDVKALSEKHPARLNPSWVIASNNSLYYNPALKEVTQHIVATVEEIVRNYDVDAIHFDDYFYPANYPLPLGEGKDGAVANSRRQHINQMVKSVGEAIRAIDEDVSFGISPMGIWKNSSSDPSGSQTSGNESYYSIYADTRTWIKNEWIDYIVPQIYWETGHKLADYQTLVKWWSNEVKGTDVELYVGHGIYREPVAGQIDTQLNITQAYPAIKGSFYYGMGSLLANNVGCKDKITLFNKQVSLAVNSGSSVHISSSRTLNHPGITTASILNIRNGSGLHHSVLTKVPKGTRVTILSTQPGWHNVRLPNGQTGWASADYVHLTN